MKSIIFTVALFAISFVTTAQARLTIENKSQRFMTVKVMKGYAGKGSVHETITVSSYGSNTVNFSQSGYYFVKTKATLKGRDPIYQRGQPFSITNDQTGYSVLTLTFSIRESSVPQITGGKEISKSEFELN